VESDEARIGGGFLPPARNRVARVGSRRPHLDGAISAER
jgi:hypothetical protein